jgi:hypothetical protein
VLGRACARLGGKDPLLAIILKQYAEKIYQEYSLQRDKDSLQLRTQRCPASIVIIVDADEKRKIRKQD